MNLVHTLGMTASDITANANAFEWTEENVRAAIAIYHIIARKAIDVAGAYASIKKLGNGEAYIYEIEDYIEIRWDNGHPDDTYFTLPFSSLWCDNFIRAAKLYQQEKERKAEEIARQRKEDEERRCYEMYLELKGIFEPKEGE